MSRLITPTIISSYKFLKNGPSSWKEKAERDFKNNLARIFSGMGEEAQQGISYEKRLNNLASEYIIGGLEEGTEIYKDQKSNEVTWAVIKKIAGGNFGGKTKAYVTIDGEEYCFFGKMDVRHPDAYDVPIMDIKTTKNYKNGKYLSSIQHKMYCYSEKLEAGKKFEYVVIEWEKYPQINELYTETYVVPERQTLEEELITEVRDFVAFVSTNPEWLELYLTKFSMYN